MTKLVSPLLLYLVQSKCSSNCDSLVRSRLEIENSGYFNAYYHDNTKSELGVPDDQIEYVLLYNHGNSQNGDDYFCYMGSVKRTKFLFKFQNPP